MKKLALVTFLALFAIGNIWAVPAKRTPVTVTQADGRSLTFVLKGDENAHQRETTDGFWIAQNNEGNWVYLIKENGELALSAVLAHNPEVRDAQENSFLNQLNKQDFVQKRNVKKKETGRVRETIAGKRRVKQLSAPSSAKILIILAQYADVKFKIANPQASISAQLNNAGYTGNGATGSARDYYSDNSRGLFTPEFDVVGPVTLANNMNYYGQNDAVGDDMRPGTMIAEAARLAAGLADFSQYDLDGDGYVDNLIVIYAGYNEAEGGAANTVWPHAWSLSDARNYENFTYPVTIDGVRVNDYACSSELQGHSGTNMAGIGTICHEFGHVIGLPDLYDTDYEDNGQAAGMGDWSLMDYGSYLNDGKTPPYLNAFEREFLGWADVTVLTEQGIYDLAHIKDGQVYRINSSVNNEYFLLENRQQTGWDTYLPGHGMLITHVDMTNPNRLSNNTLNDYANHECVDLLEADGAKKSGGYYYSSAGDPFPGTKNKTVFDDSTSPAGSKLWNGSPLNKPVFNISETDGVINFTFIDVPRFTAPVATDASDLTDASFAANWNAVDGAQNYFIDVYTKIPGNQATVMNETFAGITEVSWAVMDAAAFTQNGLSGWTGTRVYPGCSDALYTNNILNALKFGSSGSKSGDVTFPVAMDGDATITIGAKDWQTASGGEGGTYTVMHDPAGGSNFQTVGTSGTLSYDSFEEKSFEITGGTGNSKIKIDITGGRAFINSINIVSGTPEIKTYLTGYENLNVGNVNSIPVDGITDNSQLYYYVVRATDGETVSNNSNEIPVDLSTTSMIDTGAAQIKIYSSGNTLYIESETVINTIEVFNLQGQMIKTQNGTAGTNAIQLTPKQLYIIRIDGTAAKVLM